MRTASVLIVALFTIGTASFPTSAADRPPNILLIMADDVGVDAIGCYGGTSHKTPHIDALAKTGLRFNHGYSMPVCHPTRTTLLTGRYPFRQKHPRWGSFPKSDEKHTVAHFLKRAGYATAIAGKWQLALQKNDPLHPQRLGFDDSCVFGWHEGPRYYDPMIYQNGKLRTDTKGKYGPDLYVEFLAEFMKANRKKPFFAFYSMALCHDVTDDLKGPVPYAPGKSHFDTFAEMMVQMDKHVGQIVNSVDDLGLREYTVILFTGDNGTPKGNIHEYKNGTYARIPVYSMFKGKKIRGGKGDLTNGGTNVPLIANWKGTIKPGQVDDSLVDFSDWLPTLCGLAGATVPESLQIDGHSFAGALINKKWSPRQWAYSERGKKRWWVRTQRWKLYSDGELFDVASDPQEKSAIKKDTPESVAARKRLEKALSTVRH
jgi:arylsulfatase A